MEPARFHEMALDRPRATGDLPLGFARETCPGPAREGVGLEKAHMGNGFGLAKVAFAGQSELRITVGTAPPIEWCLPRLSPHGRPTEIEPELRSVIAPVGDEVAVFAIADQAVRDQGVFDEDAVRRTFIVEAEPGTRLTQRVNALWNRDPAERVR